MRETPRRTLGSVPAPHTPRRPPNARSIASIPNGDPYAQTPAQHISHAPPPRPVGKPPNPRKPQLVRDVRGGALMDLFEIFPDLPRPPRPAPRLQAKGQRRKLGVRR